MATARSKLSPITDIEFIEEECDLDLEFDAPQWADLESEREKQEYYLSSPCSNIHDSWFQECHPLHEEQKESVSTQSRCPPQQSAIDHSDNKSSLKVLKPCLSVQKVAESQRISGNEDNESITKKPRKCWKLNGHCTFSISPRSIPVDMLPKRGSSLTKESTYSALRAGYSNDQNCHSHSPLVGYNSQKSIPLQPSAPLSPANTTLRHTTKMTKKVKPTLNVTKIKEENRRPSKGKFSIDVDEELCTMLDNHNRRVLSKRAEYDQNGRRIRKGNPVTCAAPATVQTSKSPSTQVQFKIKRRSVDIIPKGLKETKQKRRSCFPLSSTQDRVSTISNNSTVAFSSKPRVARSKTFAGWKSSWAGHKEINNDTTDTENEIKELIRQHNSKLAAAKKAKK